MSLFPEASKKISVVPIGVKLYPIVKTDLKKYGNPFFLHIGGFSFEKNHKGLISIFEQLKIKFSTAKLGLVGDGKLKVEIEREVAVRGLQDSVIFFGYQANPLQYLQVADCLLLPSIIEGMPAVILESFQCHVPVVAYDVGGVREIVKVDETGWLVEKNDELAFVTAVCDVMENSQKTMRQTQQAFELVEQLFNMEVISEKFLAAYIEILNKRELLF
jgi:glycosyltransferase involved in cell wall biosynthesis